jgi:hypothetical protein
MRLLEAIHDVGPFFSFSARIARAVGGPEEGLLLQFILWKLRDVDDDVTLTAEQIEEATALTPRRQAHARENLRALGVLSEERKGIPCRTHYRVNAAWFDVVWENEKTRIDETSKQGTTKRDDSVRRNVDAGRDETSKHSLLEEHKEQLTERAPLTASPGVRNVRRKRREAPALGLEFDPEDVLKGACDTLDTRRSGEMADAVLSATVRLWASVWSTTPSRVIVTKDRRTVWRDAMKAGAKPSDFAKAILGMKHDNTSRIDREDYCDFVHVARALERFIALFEKNGDPRSQPPKRKRSDMKEQRVSNGTIVLVPRDYAWTQDDDTAATMGLCFDADARKWKRKK